MQTDEKSFADSAAQAIVDTSETESQVVIDTADSESQAVIENVDAEVHAVVDTTDTESQAVVDSTDNESQAAIDISESSTETTPIHGKTAVAEVEIQKVTSDSVGPLLCIKNKICIFSGFSNRIHFHDSRGFNTRNSG